MRDIVTAIFLKSQQKNVHISKNLLHLNQVNFGGEHLDKNIWKCIEEDAYYSYTGYIEKIFG